MTSMFGDLDKVFTQPPPKEGDDHSEGEPVTISGKISKIIMHNADSDGFFILRLAHSMGDVSVTGYAFMLTEGVKVKITGTWIEKARFGWQIKAKTVVIADQGSAVQILLSTGFLKGVKTKLAVEIAKYFGEDTFASLDHSIDNPDFLQRVKGIGKVKCGWISDSWREQRHWANAALISIRVGLTMKQARSAYDKFGDRLVEVINDNPYLLTVIDGMTWDQVDSIGEMEWPGKQRIDHDDPKRYMAAVREVLRLGYMNDGHMALRYGEAILAARELARPTLEGFESKVNDRVRNPDEGLVLVSVTGENGKMLYLEPYYKIERGTAVELLEKLGKPQKTIGDWEKIVAKMPDYAPFALSDDQLEAVKFSLLYDVSVITGGPGTGKSTIAKAICNIASDHGMSITLCAPTGKAARRLADATGRPAGTIHRTIGYSGHDRRFDFMTDIVLIDEASMIDAAMMQHVVEASAECRLILVGDVNQLPPVGAGEPFYQIIQSQVPSVRLTTIHRQGADSGIIHVAHDFNEGIVQTGVNAKWSDIEIWSIPANQALPAAVLKHMNRMIEDGNPLTEVTVLTPVNAHEWGQEELNVLLQETYNPGPFPLKACKFKAGDKIIHKKNLYDMRNQVVFNGMTGTVQWVATDYEEQELNEKRKEQGAEELPVILRAQFDGEPVETTYTRADLRYLKLAYALTIHSSQGSEYSCVVMITPTTHPNHMMRQLAYTGLTRAKKRCIILTTQSAVRTYVENEKRVRRNTFLSDLMK